MQSNELPAYVKKLSPENQSMWLAISTSVAAKESEQVGFLVANKWLQSNLKKSELKARTEQVRDRIEFILDTSEELIKRTVDGEDYVSFKLADVYKDKFGVQLPEEVLQQWAEKINSGEVVLGDVDHEMYDQLLQAGYTNEQVKHMLKSKPSIAKAVKAIYDKGRLWVRAVIDKRYKNVIQKSKGVSMEAIITRDNNNNIVSGDLLGFTFGVKHTPVIQGTGVAL
jgi:hypothetical protein